MPVKAGKQRTIASAVLEYKVAHLAHILATLHPTKMHFNYLIVALSSFATAATALAIQPRDVFSPPVLYPHSGTVWFVGQRHNVTWCVPRFPRGGICCSIVTQGYFACTGQHHE